MGNFIFRKTVDQSLLSGAMTIPVESHQEILQQLGITLERGEKQNIAVRIAGSEYEASVRSVDYRGENANRTVLQINYAEKSPICRKLNSIFAYSADVIAQRRAENPESKKQLSVEEEYMDVYSAGGKVLEFRGHPKYPEDRADMESEGGEEQLEVKEIISQIKAYIGSKGFRYCDGLIENFYLSLKSKPFVILAGISGTGKTRLVKLFAEAVGAVLAENGGNGRYKLVSVRPDWSDSSDLFGHTNLKGEFVPGAIIDFVKDACEHPDKPYFLCLDEMNLARVEYYLSDFLSVIETRRRAGSRILTDRIILDKAAGNDYGELILPENLYVVGTVNMDETTFPFSRKVLDRANTIEFSDVDLMPDFMMSEEKAEPVVQSNEFLKTQYLVLAVDTGEEQWDLAAEVCTELQEINRILQEANAHIGYRVRDEIVFYMLNNAETGLLEYDDALDNEIMQKILPRIQGSSAAVKNLLCRLFQKFAGDYSGLNQDMVWKQMDTYLDNKGCTYKNSARKICYMMRRYEEDGFTSYWL